MSEIRNRLNEMLSHDGINAVVVFGRDGFVIDAATEGSEVDADTVGAVISSNLGLTEMMGTDLGLGELARGMVEYGERVLFINQLGEEAVLAVMADPKFVGSVRYHIKKAIPVLLTAL